MIRIESEITTVIRWKFMNWNQRFWNWGSVKQIFKWKTTSRILQNTRSKMLYWLFGSVIQTGRSVCKLLIDMGEVGQVRGEIVSSVGVDNPIRWPYRWCRWSTEKWVCDLCDVCGWRFQRRYCVRWCQVPVLWDHCCCLCFERTFIGVVFGALADWVGVSTVGAWPLWFSSWCASSSNRVISSSRAAILLPIFISPFVRRRRILSRCSC